MIKETIDRVFVFDKIILADLAPELSPSKSILVYKDLFPEIVRRIAIPDKVSSTEGRWYFNLIKVV